MLELQGLLTVEQLEAMRRVREHLETVEVPPSEQPQVLSPTARAPMLMDLE